MGWLGPSDAGSGWVGSEKMDPGPCLDILATSCNLLNIQYACTFVICKVRLLTYLLTTYLHTYLLTKAEGRRLEKVWAAIPV